MPSLLSLERSHKGLADQNAQLEAMIGRRRSALSNKKGELEGTRKDMDQIHAALRSVSPSCSIGKAWLPSAWS